MSAAKGGKAGKSESTDYKLEQWSVWIVDCGLSVHEWIMLGRHDGWRRLRNDHTGLAKDKERQASDTTTLRQIYEKDTWRRRGGNLCRQSRQSRRPLVQLMKL